MGRQGRESKANAPGRLARLGLALAVPASMLAISSAAVSAPNGGSTSGGINGPSGPDSGPEVHHDTSRPLRSIQPSSNPGASHAALHAHSGPSESSNAVASDTSGPRSPGRQIPTTSTNFGGIGANGSAPPDNDGAIGPTQYVELVNQQFEVFNKSGSVVLSARNTNTLWSGFGGGCQANNDGDGTVLWDPLAQRWVLQQFSVSTTPYLDCVAISTTSDATGTWNRYSFQFSSFPDYPKMGVWPDAYYASFNLFNAAGTQGLGAELCAFNRAAMLTGTAATAQCVMATTSGESTSLPATIDGTTAPPAGEPEWFVALSPTTANALAYWKFHVDWTTPANTNLSVQATLPVSAFSQACGGGTCIPQSGTSQQLDSLGDRLMFRLAYRNFGDHEAMVVNHSVTTGSSVGERWYELRPNGSSLSVFQQGTYAPDATYRWMGSIALDQSGDMALGFSASSSALHPGIRYTGRLASDPAGQMPQGESTIITGAGSQGSVLQSLSRWGDYTEMTVDPVDQCTFWYVNQYEAANGTFNWSTQIGSFKFPSCGGTVTNDFSMAANPTSVTVTQGATGTSTISTATTSGSAQSVSFSASGLPTGATASFNPTSVTAGASSTLTITTSATTPTGTSTITITGTGTNATHSTTVNLTVNAPAANDFSIGASPTSVSVNQGNSGTSTISTAVTSGSAQNIALSASGLPTGATAAFNPSSVTAGGSSTLTLSTAATTPAGTYAVTVTATGASATHTTTVNLTVVANDFSMGANPSSVTVTQGSNSTSTITTTLTSGSAQSIALSASGLPSGATAAFNPASVNSGGSSTLTLSTVATTPTGTSTITITGTGTNATHSTTVNLTVNASGGGAVVTNGGFETGTFAGWTTAGPGNAIVNGGHTGTYAARVGSTGPASGDSTVSQTVTIPAGNSQLTLWYQPHCTDTITYDWERVEIHNTSNTLLATPLNVCSNSGAWTQVTFSTTPYAGQTVILVLLNHDDNYPTDPTYTLFDDVSIAASAPPPPNPVVNGGFETGTFSGWTTSGASESVVSGGHSGSWAARLGSTVPTNGDSIMQQTVTIPSSATSLTFWYKMSCPDTLTYDWALVQIRNTSNAVLATPLAKTCATNATWVQVTYSVTALRGQTVVLWFSSHDDNYGADPSYTLYDDIAVI